MQEHRFEFTIVMMARVLGVSCSGFYAWTKRLVDCAARKARSAFDARVSAIFEQYKGRYGAPRIAVELHDEDTQANRKTVAASLHRQGSKARAAHKFKVTTNSEHSLNVAPNLLMQDFSADTPNQKWVADITYLPTDEGWLYLAIVLDLYSRRVVGWAMDKRMKTGLVCDALTMALHQREWPTGVIVHSDRGSQYCSHAYQRIIDTQQLKCSMSRRGDCYDNSCAESFFHTLKVELTHGVRYETRAHLRHSTLGFISPGDFEALKVA
jgi:putative transposase